MPVKCPNCGVSPYLLEKHSKVRGTFLRCPECKAEMDPEEVESGAESGSEPAAVSSGSDPVATS